MASIIAHVIVLTVWARTNAPRLAREWERGAVVLFPTPGDSTREVPIQWLAPQSPPVRPAAAGPVLGGPAVALTPDTATGLRVRPGGGRDSSGTGVGRGGPGGFTLADAIPQYGDGRLWVRPMWLPPEGSGRPIRMDSIAAVRMLALADSMERHPPTNQNANPYVSRPWTFRRNGKLYGWDAGGIHLGDFTIPNAVLAFLPFPQGNIDQARANAALMEMRADIMRAAARAAAEEDFRQAVRDIRVRRDRERSLQRARDSVRSRLTP